jgi:hypothetical protein
MKQIFSLFLLNGRKRWRKSGANDNVDTKVAVAVVVVVGLQLPFSF